MMAMTRKQFLRGAVGFAAASFGLTLLGCGGSSGPTPGPDASGGGPHPQADNCLQNGTNATIGANHGHVLVVSKQDVASGADMTYHIRGSATHDHTVSITAADFTSLQQAQAIVTSSSTDEGHAHPIMVACA